MRKYRVFGAIDGFAARIRGRVRASRGVRFLLRMDTRMSESRWLGRVKSVLRCVVHRCRRFFVRSVLDGKIVGRFRVLSAVLSGVLLLCLPFLSLLPYPTITLTLYVIVVELLWLVTVLTDDCRLGFGAVDVGLLLVVLSVFCSGLFGAGGKNGFFHAIVTCALLLFWFPMRDLFCRSPWRDRAALALKCACVFAALWGIFEYFSGKATLRWVDLSRFSDIGGRVCGPFSNPNIFAVFLVATAPLFLAGAVEMTSRFWRMLHLFSFGVCLLCLVLTWSRGGWLALLVATACFFLLHSMRTMKCLLLGLLPLGIGAFFLPHSVTNRFLSIGSLSESSINYRFLTWRGVLSMIRAHPLGIGAGNDAFAAVYPTYAVSGTERTVHTHALVLQILAEQGIQGLLIFLFFLTLLVLSFVRVRMTARSGQATREAAFCGIVGVLTMGLFDYVWYHPGMLFLFFTLAALIPANEDSRST